MKAKYLFIISMALLLLASHTSCSRNRSSATSASDELLYKQHFDSLRQLVYRGDNDAALQLASCYLEGKGVERSYFNAASIHFNYGGFTEADIDSIINSYPLDDPYRALVENEPFVIIEELLPLEAAAIETYYDPELSDDAERYLKTLERLERKGSELSVYYQYLLYAEWFRLGVDEDAYMEFLEKHSDRYPVFYGVLGNIYLDKSIANPTLSTVRIAISSYCRAKSYGMLNSRECEALSSLYEECKEIGLMPVCSENSMSQF